MLTFVSLWCLLPTSNILLCEHEHDQQSLITTGKELGRLIENDKKMKEFMRQKERNRGVEEHKGDLSTA